MDAKVVTGKVLKKYTTEPLALKKNMSLKDIYCFQNVHNFIIT